MPSSAFVPLSRFFMTVVIAVAIPSASCLIVPIIEPDLIADFAASVASTPNTGITVLPSLL